MSDIEVERDGGIATVRLNRPGKRNAMTLAMWRDTARVFAMLGADRGVRAILLAGAGGHFSVGADVSEFDAVRGSAAAATDYETAVDACADAIAEAPKPVIAVLDGYCLGGGCHLALAADFRFASPGASIGIPSARLSIVYGVRSTQRLLALVGLSMARHILYTGERIETAAALGAGLIDRIDEANHAEAMAYATALAANAPLSIAGAKAILTRLGMGPGALDPGLAQRLIDRAADSGDYAEGRRAFAARRPPRFTGE